LDKENNLSKKTTTKTKTSKTNHKKTNTLKEYEDLLAKRLPFIDKIPSIPDSDKFRNYIKSYTKNAKHLLFINADDEELKVLIGYTVGKLSDVRGSVFEKVIHIDCKNKDDKGLLDKVLDYELENKVLILFGVSEQNSDFLKEMRFRFLCADSPLIIGILKKGGKQSSFLKELPDMFEVIKLPSQTKKQQGKLKEGGKREYLKDKELKPLLKGILKEYERSHHTLAELAEIVQKRIEKEYGLRKRKTDFKMVPYYSPSKLKAFLSTLRKTGKLRKAN
jgi:hypothetical protein